MSYKEELLNPNISLTQLSKNAKIPDKLYKYQNFYLEDGSQNQYWRKNMQGEFHLSLGNEFEDINDCKPCICKSNIKQKIKSFLKTRNVDSECINLALNQLKNQIIDNSINNIINNYQNNIRIGCFTDAYNNNYMWEKYGGCHRGFCIEYDTNNERLFSLSMLPICYISTNYDMSNIVSKIWGMEYYRNLKNMSLSELLQSPEDEKEWEKILNTVYAPVFFKNKKRWAFEKEYRMFVVKNRKISNDILKMEDVLDKNYNVDLSRAIRAIYLGKNFNENRNSNGLYQTILNIREKNKSELKFDIYRINKYGQAEKQ